MWGMKAISPNWGYDCRERAEFVLLISLGSVCVGGEVRTCHYNVLEEYLLSNQRGDCGPLESQLTVMCGSHSRGDSLADTSWALDS